MILPPGDYPFIDQRLPLSSMMMAEAPHDLEVIFKRQAAINGIELVRDIPVELRCEMPEGAVATFLIWWPTGHDRIHMLIPKEHVSGKA